MNIRTYEVKRKTDPLITLSAIAPAGRASRSGADGYKGEESHSSDEEPKKSKLSRAERKRIKAGEASPGTGYNPKSTPPPRQRGGGN